MNKKQGVDMKKILVLVLIILSGVIIFGREGNESNYLSEWAEYRNLEGGIKGGTDTKAGFDSLKVKFVGNWTFGYSNAVTNDTIRDVCFLGSGGGVYILDVSKNYSPIKLSEGIHTRGFVNGLYYDYTTKRLYIAAGEVGVEIWDVSDLSKPMKVGYCYTPGTALDVYVSGSYAYVADGDYGLRIINISNPTNPTSVGYYDTPGYAWDVYVSGSYAYVADDYTGLRIIDISNPTTPRSVGYCDTPGYAYDVYVSGNYAYVADGSLRIIDISNPTTPREVGYYDTPGLAYEVYVSGSYAYVADEYYGLQIYKNLLLNGINEKDINKEEVKTNNYFIKYNVSDIEIYFGVSEESKLKVSIYDKTGRELKKLYEGKIEKGYSKVTINKQDYPTGEYFIKGYMGGTFINTKVLILR